MRTLLAHVPSLALIGFLVLSACASSDNGKGAAGDTESDTGGGGDVGRDLGQDPTADPVQDPQVDATPDAGPDVAEDVAADTGADGIGEDVSGDAGADGIGEDVSGDAAEDATEDAVEDTTEDAVEDTTEDTVEETTEDALEDATEDADATEDTTEDADVTEDVAGDTPGDVGGDVPDEVSPVLDDIFVVTARDLGLTDQYYIVYWEGHDPQDDLATVTMEALSGATPVASYALGVDDDTDFYWLEWVPPDTAGGTAIGAELFVVASGTSFDTVRVQLSDAADNTSNTMQMAPAAVGGSGDGCRPWSRYYDVHACGLGFYCDTGTATSDLLDGACAVSPGPNLTAASVFAYHPDDGFCTDPSYPDGVEYHFEGNTIAPLLGFYEYLFGGAYSLLTDPGTGDFSVNGGICFTPGSLPSLPLYGASAAAVADDAGLLSNFLLFTYPVTAASEGQDCGGLAEDGSPIVCNDGLICNGSSQCETAAAGEVCGAELTVPTDATAYDGTLSSTASDDYLGTCTTGTQPQGDIVLDWTSDTTGTVTLSTVNDNTDINFDTMLYVREGSCRDGLEVACNDDFDPANSEFRSQVTFDATSGTHYFIFVEGYNGDSGNFEITITRP